MNFTITINNLKWTVHAVPSSHPKLFLRKNPVYGITYYDTSEIYIRNTDISKSLLKRVCRHEITHALTFSYAFDTDHIGEEELCNFVEAYGPEIHKLAKLLYKKIKSTHDE